MQSSLSCLLHPRTVRSNMPRAPRAQRPSPTDERLPLPPRSRSRRARSRAPRPRRTSSSPRRQRAASPEHAAREPGARHGRLKELLRCCFAPDPVGKGRIHLPHVRPMPLCLDGVAKKPTLVHHVLSIALSRQVPLHPAASSAWIQPSRCSRSPPRPRASSRPSLPQLARQTDLPLHRVEPRPACFTSCSYYTRRIVSLR
uniref:Uncharacterized protein n=1 Tax=Aegilops tauschii subsp. strangulata TaxID=200361 RepID=A0A453PRN3_AEGTS